MKYCECSLEDIKDKGFFMRDGKAICKNCRNPDISEKPNEVSLSDVTPSEKNADYSKLIAAQNRTTHAVRSLAITFVAAPLVTLVVLVAIGIAYATQNLTVVVIVGIAGFVVLLIVLLQTLDELHRSKV